MRFYRLSSPETGRFARIRKVALILGATVSMLTAATGPALAAHDGVHAEVVIMRGSTVVNGYSGDFVNPGNEMYFIHLWSVSSRDYKRITSCWGGSAREVTIKAGLYNVIDPCLMSGQWKIEASANFKGDEMFPIHENDVVVKITVNTAPQP
jgi:hypothetical protein